MPAVDVSLAKAKYRTRNRRYLHRQDVEQKLGIPMPGTPVYTAGRFSTKPRTNSPRAKVNTLRPRRKAWGPWL